MASTPILDAGAVTRHVRAAVRSVGLRGDGNFDVSTIGIDTDLESLGVDSMIVGDLHARLLRAYGLPIDPAAYKTLTTPQDIANMLLELRARVAPTNEAAAAVVEDTDQSKSYREIAWEKGLDGVFERASKDAWQALGW